jgi:hypothetical protein
MGIEFPDPADLSGYYTKAQVDTLIASIPGGETIKRAILAHETNPQISGGATLTNQWQDSPLNIIRYSDIPGLALSADFKSIILLPGKYELSWFRQVIYTNRVQTRLYNLTTNAPIADTLGTTGFSGSDGDGSRGEAIITLESTTNVISLQEWCYQASESYGFGVNNLSGVFNSVHALMKIAKIS